MTPHDAYCLTAKQGQAAKKAPNGGQEWHGAQSAKGMQTYTEKILLVAATCALPKRKDVQHLQEAADVVAHELPQDGQQQLVLAVQDVDAADVHQRQRQHPPRDAHHLHIEVMLPLLSICSC